MSSILDQSEAAAPVRSSRSTMVDEPIPTTRLVRIELRKMFDTRSGFWLMTSIVVTSLLATLAVIVFAPDDVLTFSAFATAIGAPISIILPVMAVLSVTSEWSQRSGLTTFALVPRRGRVIWAKALCVVGVSVVSMLLAAAIGAVGNVIGSSINGVPAVWDADAVELLLIVLSNVLGLLIGFMLGVVTRSSAAGVTAYFVYSFVLPGISGALASFQDWWRDLAPWLDFSTTITVLYEGSPSGEQWVQLLTSGTLWLVIPLAIGVRLVLRSEVK